MGIVKEESTSINMKMTKYGWCSQTEIKIFGKLDREIKQKKKDDSKQDRPFIMPKEKRETIKIDWRRGDM
ncbi:hypothetical protein [Pediococcus pentosaceus]|uniref:hypothetical protein n=1 Tax=Pediococcus pentosaceus TaxID=1255 RepID=UPI002AB48410|nr:hypothetical protein [Pediococcus pentosaceus]MDY8105896.1 hypothetical protein [Pediococcus pentosaceus]